MSQLVERLAQLKPERIVLGGDRWARTGGAGQPGGSGPAVVTVNPCQVRDFARATGGLAKTDALDAQVLAHFGEVVQPALRQVPDAATRELLALLAAVSELGTLRHKQLAALIGVEPLN